MTDWDECAIKATYLEANKQKATLVGKAGYTA